MRELARERPPQWRALQRNGGALCDAGRAHARFFLKLEQHLLALRVDVQRTGDIHEAFFSEAYRRRRSSVFLLAANCALIVFIIV